jgi:uncharacterized membrane protein
MAKGRLEAFSDGVLAILITIMVLGLKVPSGSQVADLAPLAPTMLSYVLSFALLGTYWNNHHARGDRRLRRGVPRVGVR